MSWLVRSVAALLVGLVLSFFFFWLMAGLVFPGQSNAAAATAGVLALGCAGAVWYFWPNKPRPSRRAVTALLVYFAVRFVLFWLMPGLFSSDPPNLVAGAASDVLALACAAAVWYFWPKTPAPPSRPQTETSATSEPAYLPRVMFCSMIAGTVGFAGGFFGPMIFRPDSNLGPLFGIIVTGPLGFLLGPVIGVATMIRRTSLAALPRAASWLALQFVLACGFYWLFAEVFVWNSFGLMMLLATAIVGAVLFAHTLKHLDPPRAIVAMGVILLVGIAAMLVLSTFPPVMAPSWGKAPGAGAPLPAFAFIFAPAFDTSRHVPLYTIDRNQWGLEVLFVAACVGIGLLMVRIKAASRGHFDGK